MQKPAANCLLKRHYGATGRRCVLSGCAAMKKVHSCAGLICSRIPQSAAFPCSHATRVQPASRRWPCGAILLASQATPVERSQFALALKSLGLGRISGVSMAVACAYGALESPTAEGRLGTAILDIGSHVSEFSLVATDIVIREHISWGSSDLDRELREYLNQEFELEVSESVSERLKQGVGVLLSPSKSDDPESVEFTSPLVLPESVRNKISFVGRDRSTGLPVERELDSSPLSHSLEGPLTTLVELCRRVLDHLPPLLAKDVLEKGLILTGGGSCLEGLPQWLSAKLQLPVERAQQAQHCGVLGALKAPRHLCKDL